MRLYATGLPASVWSFNPRTPCGVRHPTNWRDCPPSQVSIHALLAECDRLRPKNRIRRKSFNPRTPCGVRLFMGSYGNLPRWFQSTHSLRSATASGEEKEVIVASFNPRTPCGVRPGMPTSLTKKWIVSIHALLAECDTSSQEIALFIFLFQSTHSLRSATDVVSPRIKIRHVSIHALLAECDFCELDVEFILTCFNPRTPCGVRQVCQRGLNVPWEFQSTHSLRSATVAYSTVIYPSGVSIHALLAECDERRHKL